MHYYYRLVDNIRRLETLKDELYRELDKMADVNFAYNGIECYATDIIVTRNQVVIEPVDSSLMLWEDQGHKIIQLHEFGEILEEVDKRDLDTIIAECEEWYKNKDNGDLVKMLDELF